MSKLTKNFSWNKEIKSFVITFLVTFFMIIHSQIDNFTLEAFKNGAYWGVIFGAVRAGLKAVIELFIAMFSKE